MPVATHELLFRGVSLDVERARALERKHIAEMDSLTHDGGPPRLDARKVTPPDGYFAVGVIGSAWVACGGFLQLTSGVAELKRVWVDPTCRRQGVARRLVAFLESRCATAGYLELWLETHVAAVNAIALYESVGFRPIPNYGRFEHNLSTRSYSRKLTVDSTSTSI